MPSLQELRRAAARTIGTLEYGTASSGSGTGVAQVTITSYPFKSSILSAWAKDKWLYRPERTLAADADRRCATHTASTGVLTNDLDWSDDPDGEVIEVLSPSSGSDLNRYCNDALKRLFSVEEFTFVVSAPGDRRHNLTSSATWLTNGNHVFQVGTLNTSTDDRDEVDPFRDGRFVRGTTETNAGKVWLIGPRFNTSQTVYVKAIRSHYSLCRASGGTYGDQDGLTNEDDDTAATLDQVRWAAKWIYLEELLAQEQNPQAKQAAVSDIARTLVHLDSACRRTGFERPRKTLMAPANMAATPGGSW